MNTDTLKIIGNSSQDFSNSINLLNVLISALTLLLAYVAFKVSRYIAKNHLKTKQVDLVCELIECLNNSSIKVGFATFNKDGHSFTGAGFLFNIFELGNYDKIPDGLNIKYEDEVVLFKSNSNQILNIKKYINNPLTPKRIADELLRFYNRNAFHIDTTDSNYIFKNFVLIETGILGENIIFNDALIKNKSQIIESNLEVFLSWKHLKESSKHLKIIIEKWLKENNIKENNIREDFKNHG